MRTLIDTLQAIDVSSLPLLTAIYAIAAVFSGLSGFGFSAIGAFSLLMVPPQLGIPLLMVLSLASQAVSCGSLSRELRGHAGAWYRRDGVMPYLAGGIVGLPIGLAILGSMATQPLLFSLGLLLVIYAVWSLRVPAVASRAMPATSLRNAMLVGAAGGVVGGVAAFPGSALVIWNGVVGRTKEQSRALTQPFILIMQTAAVLLLLVQRPELFDATFWTLFFVALPGTVIGNELGVAIYRGTGDLGYRRITLVSLGLTGVGLLAKVVLA